MTAKMKAITHPIIVTRNTPATFDNPKALFAALKCGLVCQKKWPGLIISEICTTSLCWLDENMLNLFSDYFGGS